MKSNWEKREIGEVCNIFSGNSINEELKKKKYLGNQSGMPYVATKDISYDGIINYNNGVRIPNTDINNFRIGPKHSTFICAEGGSAGRKVGFTDRDVCFVNKLFALVPKESIESKYIYYWCQTADFKFQFNKKLSGIIGGVSQNKFKELTIAFPPLSEQQRIVALLDQALSAIDIIKANTEKNLHNTSVFFEARKEDVYTKLERSYQKKNIKDVCKIRPPKDEVRNRLSNTDMVSFVPMADLQISKKVFDTKIEKQLYEVISAYTYFANEDVLLAKITPCFENGKLGVAKNLKNGVGFGSSEFIVFRPDTSLSNEYLYYYLSRESFRIQGAQRMTGTVGQKRVSLDFIENSLIPLPPISIQNKVVEMLDELSRYTSKLEANFNKKLEYLTELKQSILHEAFNGEL